MSYIDNRGSQFNSFAQHAFHKQYDSLSSSWVRLSNSWNPPGFYVQEGIVYGQGLINSGSAGAVLNLAGSFAPFRRHIYASPSGTSTLGGRIDMTATTVEASTFPGGWLSLDAFQTPLDITQWRSISADLVNSWVDYGSTYQEPIIYKDSLGFVHMAGLIKNGTVNSVFYTLPEEYRPAKRIQFPAYQAGNRIGAIVITPDGACDTSFPSGGSNGFFSLNNVVFMAESSPYHNDFVEVEDFETGFTKNDGSVYYPLGYFIAPNGRVYFRGIVDVTSPAVGTTNFNITLLPDSIVPQKGVLFCTYINGGATTMRINAGSNYLTSQNLTGGSALLFDGMNYVYPKQSLGSLL